jgi:hypothetical protein
MLKFPDSYLGQPVIRTRYRLAMKGRYTIGFLRNTVIKHGPGSGVHNKAYLVVDEEPRNSDRGRSPYMSVPRTLHFSEK